MYRNSKSANNDHQNNSSLIPATHLRNKTTGLLLTLALASCLSIGTTAFADSYQNIFLSYYSPANVQAMTNYAKAKHLGGLIIWEFSGDVQTTILINHC